MLVEWLMAAAWHLLPKRQVGVTSAGKLLYEVG